MDHETFRPTSEVPFPARRVRAADVEQRAYRRPAARILSGLALTGLLAACGTAPLSYLYDRSVYHPVVLHRYPVYIVSVDGQSSTFDPMPITAGTHVVAIDAKPVAGFREPLRKTYTMTIAPCTRYYVAAQRDDPLTQNWNLVVEQTYPVDGCDPQKEIQKAQLAVSKGQQPPLSSALLANPDVGPGALPPPQLRQVSMR